MKKYTLQFAMATKAVFSEVVVFRVATKIKTFLKIYHYRSKYILQYTTNAISGTRKYPIPVSESDPVVGVRHRCRI